MSSQYLTDKINRALDHHFKNKTKQKHQQNLQTKQTSMKLTEHNFQGYQEFQYNLPRKCSTPSQGALTLTSREPQHVGGL